MSKENDELKSFFKGSDADTLSGEGSSFSEEIRRDIDRSNKEYEKELAGLYAKSMELDYEEKELDREIRNKLMIEYGLPVGIGIAIGFFVF